MRSKLSCLGVMSGATRSRVRSSTAVAVVAGLLLLGSSVLAGAVTVPPWLQSQVGAALPAHDADTAAVTLYSEVNVTVLPDGRMRRAQRVVYRILRAEGGARAVVRVDFDASSRVTRMHGWSIPAQGKPYEVSEKDSVESSLLGVLYGELVSDLRSKVLRIPAAIPGSTIGYELEEELQPRTLTDNWMFQDTIPVREAHYNLELPPGWRYRGTWLNHPEEPATQAGPARWQWQVQGLEAIEPEGQMPPMPAVAGWFALSLLPPPGRDQGFQSWSEMGLWYRKLTSGRTDASADIKSKVAELTNSQPTMLGKMQALANFVQTEVRYVAVELGLGSMQPQSATDVFTHRYGDCKDKVTLLSSMLKQIGVESHYVLVNATRGVVTDSTPVGFGFNHVILAIQLPPDASDPMLLATYAHAKLGRLLFFDPTDSYTPLGQMAAQLQGGYGLLVGPDAGELIQLPQLAPSSNSLERTAHLQLDEGGQLSGDVHEVWTGDVASRERGMLDAATQAERIKSIEAVMTNAFANYQLTKAIVVNRQAPSRPLEWNYSLQADQYAKLSGDILTVRPRVLGAKSTALLETEQPRKYDIELEGPRRDTDVFEITLPDGYQVEELPPRIDEEHSFASYHSRTEAVGRTLRYSRTLEWKRLSVPLVQADELKTFNRVIFNDEGMPAVLEKVRR